MTFNTDLLAFIAETQKAQKALDSSLSLELVSKAQEEFASMLASAQSVSIAVKAMEMVGCEVEAAQNLAQKLAPQFEAVQKMARKFAHEFDAAEKLAQNLAPQLEAVQKLVREGEALLASFAVPVRNPCSNLDWSAISPRPHVRKPSLDLEPSSERTIVRPEVKRKIGF